jgi:glucokinase
VVCALAIDIGGTKLAAALVDEHGAVHHARAVPTRGADAEALFAALIELVDAVRTAGAHDRRPDMPGPVVCGVGCGGPMAPGGETVSPLNIPQWRAFALRDRLAQHLGLPVHVDNDAKALALAEGWCGAARGARDYVALVVSTGVGGGVVVDGRLLHGAHANAGHLGHVVAVPGGRRCACGARGCLEAEASGRSIEAYTGRPARDAPEAVRVRTGRLVGEVVGSIVHLLDLRLAVVAGSVALGFGPVFFAAAQDALARTAQLSFAAGARIVPAGLGASGPLVGAAAVAWRAMGIDLAEPPHARPAGPEGAP